MQDTTERSRHHRLRGEWLERPSGRVRVWSAGSGPTILAIHGLGGSGRYWDGLARRVGDRFTVVAPDLPGFGASEKPPILYDRSLHLGALRAVADRFGAAEPPVVVGHSVGGLLAVLFGGSRSSGVRGLSLTAAPYPEPGRHDAPGSSGPSGAIAPPSAHLDAAGSSLPGGTASVVLRATWPAVSVPIALARRYPYAVVRDYGRQTLRARSWTLWSLLHDPTVEGDLAEAERRLDPAPPVLLMHAEDDRTVNVGALAEWSRTFPRAERVVTATGGHQVLLRTNFDPLVRWLDGLPA